MAETQTTEAEMEEILSSIRSTVEEEAGAEEPATKATSVETQPTEDVTKTAEINNAIDSEEVMDLTNMIIDEDDKSPPKVKYPEVSGSFLDVKHFTEQNELKEADIKEVQAAHDRYIDDVLGPEEEDSNMQQDDDIDISVDDIMSEMEESGELPASDETNKTTEEDTANADAMAQLAELEAAANAQVAEQKGEETSDESSAEDTTKPEPSNEEVTENTTEEVSEESSTTEEPIVDAAVNEAVRHVQLSASPSASGLQVHFPVEVLAEALRPLVKGWIQENLADIVERLVKEELSRLADK